MFCEDVRNTGTANYPSLRGIGPEAAIGEQLDSQQCRITGLSCDGGGAG